MLSFFVAIHWLEFCVILPRQHRSRSCSASYCQRHTRRHQKGCPEKGPPRALRKRGSPGSFRGSTGSGDVSQQKTWSGLCGPKGQRTSNVKSFVGSFALISIFTVRRTVLLIILIMYYEPATFVYTGRGSMVNDGIPTLL